MAKNAYNILGVPNEASFEVIKSAYRRLAMRFHPDRNSDNPIAEKKFKEISDAYEILSDTEKRADYDKKIKPLQSIADLLIRHNSGERLLEIMLPSAPAARTNGANGVFIRKVSRDLLLEGGKFSTEIPVSGMEKTFRSVTINLTAGEVNPRWFRIKELGFTGKNGGLRGTLWLVLIPKN